MSSSLYSLIKRVSQQKGKKLKIICNINDVIRPMKSSCLYGISDKAISFKEYHKIFWEKRDYKSSDGVRGDDENSKKIEKNLKSFENYQKDRANLRKTITDPNEYKKKTAELEKKYMGNWNYLSNRPFTTIAADLLKCLKENLIEELVFGLASWTQRDKNLSSVLNNLRIDEFNQTFRHFPQCFFINGNNQEITEYWKRAKAIRPDFDIWISTLDPGNINAKAFKLIYDNHGPDKIYVLPDYHCNRYAEDMDRVHLVKNEISNLKNKDFNIKKEEELNNDNTKIKFYFLGFVTPLILFGIYYVTKKIQLRNIKK
jgi:hypothetical protein